MLNVITGVLDIPTPPVTSAYESISTQTVSSAVSSITFSSIPSTYKHLQIRILSRSSRAVALDGITAWLNSDLNTANYDGHGLYGTGSAAAAYYDASNGMLIGAQPGSSATANCYGGFVMDILDYTNTNKYKTSRTLGGVDLNGSGQIRFISGLWMSTAAVTSIKIDTSGGGNLEANSSFALYGIKG